MSTIQGPKVSTPLMGAQGSVIQSPYTAPQVADFFKPVNTILQDKTLYPWGNAYTWDFMPWNWGKSDREPNGPIVQAPDEFRTEQKVSNNLLMFGAAIAGALFLLKRRP